MKGVTQPVATNRGENKFVKTFPLFTYANLGAREKRISGPHEKQ